MQGAASAYLAAVKRVGWASKAPHTITTLNGSLIDLLETAPKVVRKWTEDDWAAVESAKSTIAVNMNDLTGSRGYGVGLDVAAGGAVLLGQGAQAEQRREEALGQKRMKIQGGLVPWFEPLRMLVKAAKRTKEGVSEGLRSAVALAEGGWRTQLHLCAAGLADHPYCTACGPLSASKEVEGDGTHEGCMVWGGEGELGMRQEWEHIDWGGTRRRSYKRDAKMARSSTDSYFAKGTRTRTEAKRRRKSRNSATGTAKARGTHCGGVEWRPCQSHHPCPPSKSTS